VRVLDVVDELLLQRSSGHAKTSLAIGL
jgi:hypothetical protein